MEMTTNGAGKKEPPYIVGIGASAGGLDALVSLFSAMPPDSGMAFVVVQHLSPDHKSHMVELLAKHTAMPVEQARDGIPVQPNHIYLIPPSKNITIYHGSLFLAEQDRTLGHINFPIDLFFDSLAKDQGDAAIAVILSGTGSDGTRGIGVIKSEGGLILAQDPDTAQYGGMPRSAIRTDLVDRVLAPEALPEALLQYIDAPRRTRESMKADGYDGQEKRGLAKIHSLLRHEFDLDFSAYKPTTICRRIAHRMNIQQKKDLQDYVECLRTDAREAQMLYRDLLIGVTQFFRDPEAFEALEKQVIPRIVETALERQVRSVRVWVPGCSTGEEAYSIAMLFHEYMRTQDKALDLKIFATDVDEDAASRAASGAFPENIVTNLSPDRLRTFFIKIGGQYQVTRELRKSVIFATHDLLQDPPFSKLDLISCRNVLIYLKPETQQQVFSTFNYALREDGFLFLGSSESISGGEGNFTAVSAKHRIYRGQGAFPGYSGVSPDIPPLYRHSVVEPSGEPATSVRPTQLIDSLFSDLLDEYVPAAILVGEEGEVLHVFGEVNRYLRVATGQASMNLHKMLIPEIRMLVGTAMHKAEKDNERIVYPDVKIEAEAEEPHRFDLIVEVCEEKNGVRLFFIIFDDMSPDEAMHFPEVERSYDIDAAAQERIEDLNQKLDYTQENLQATVEELETSNEELQATNEELMAANEELQSTNEELHSVNQELVTVNAELQEKIRELTELNTDMDNLLQSTEVSTIFLDTELCIRKFTASAADYVNLLPSDNGRPIQHFVHIFDDINLHACAQGVLETQESIQREIRDDDGNWYRFQSSPYWTPDEIVKGVVLTFADITEMKALRSELAAERQQRRALETEEEVSVPPSAESQSPTDS